MPEFLSIFSAYIQNFLLVLLDGALLEMSRVELRFEATEENRIR